MQVWYSRTQIHHHTFIYNTHLHQSSTLLGQCFHPRLSSLLDKGASGSAAQSERFCAHDGTPACVKMTQMTRTERIWVNTGAFLWLSRSLQVKPDRIHRDGNTSEIVIFALLLTVNVMRSYIIKIANHNGHSVFLFSI